MDPSSIAAKNVLRTGRTIPARTAVTTGAAAPRTTGAICTRVTVCHPCARLPTPPPYCTSKARDPRERGESSMPVELQTPPPTQASVANAKLVINRAEALRLLKAQIERGLEIK